MTRAPEVRALPNASVAPPSSCPMTTVLALVIEAAATKPARTASAARP